MVIGGNYMRYGEIKCEDCGQFFSFESVNTHVNCINCEKSYNIEDYPTKETETTEPEVDYTDKQELIERLIGLGALWLTNVDQESIPLEYLLLLEESMSAEVNQEDQANQEDQEDSRADQVDPEDGESDGA